MMRCGTCRSTRWRTVQLEFASGSSCPEAADLAGPQGNPTRRATFEDRRTTSPLWTRDGRDIILASGDVFSSRPYRVAADGSSRPCEIASVGEAGAVIAISHAAGRLVHVREAGERRHAGRRRPLSVRHAGAI
jgi:hypothetical protein